MANEQEREKLIDSCNPKIEKRSGGRPMSDDLVERLRRRARAEESGGTCDLQMEDVGALLREAISAIEAKGKALAECRLAISGELNLADAMQVKLLEAREAERAAGKLALAAEQEIARLRAENAALAEAAYREGHRDGCRAGVDGQRGPRRPLPGSAGGQVMTAPDMTPEERAAEIAREMRGLHDGDHERGCDGRCYRCSCDYDARVMDVLDRGAAEIARLCVTLAAVEAERDRAMQACEQIAARLKAAEEALTSLVDECVDYQTRNNLGDPEKQHNIKRARAALRALRGQTDE